MGLAWLQVVDLSLAFAVVSDCEVIAPWAAALKSSLKILGTVSSRSPRLSSNEVCKAIFIDGGACLLDDIAIDEVAALMMVSSSLARSCLASAIWLGFCLLLGPSLVASGGFLVSQRGLQGRCAHAQEGC